MSYRAPLSEYQFLFDHVVNYSEIAAQDRFEDATSDVVAAVLNEAGHLSAGQDCAVEPQWRSNTCVFGKRRCAHLAGIRGRV